jgi:hypothetical protein
MAKCIQKAVVIGLVALSWVARAQESQIQNNQATGKVIIQSVPPSVSVDPSVPSLQLSETQRAHIARILIEKHTDVSLDMKENESAKNFEPHVNETIPKGLESEAFPPPLTSEIPLMKRYTYLKFKDQVLIVNPMTRKIVDMFPATKQYPTEN